MTQHPRNIYLKLKTLEEARAAFMAAWPRPQSPPGREVPLTRAAGRITAEPVFARLSSPAFHSAAMDGVAVHAPDTYGASPEAPRRLRLGEKAILINTGHAMPQGKNAVIMIENVREEEGEAVIEAAAFPWQHVRRVGEDIVATQMIAPAHLRLGPYELGALAAGGHASVRVLKRPRVHILPTGSELVDHENASQDLARGRVVEYNSVILAALARQCGAEPVVHPITPDDYGLILSQIRKALAEDADLVIINAGSSAGSEDYTAMAIGELGEVLVHGVTIMPGKPTILGLIGQTPVIGNPGYPVSAVISFEQFAAPLIAAMLGQEEDRRPGIDVLPAQALPSRPGLEEFLRVRLGRVDGRFLAAPLPRGAGSITTLTQADGIIRIPAESEGLAPGEPVRAELLRPRAAIENTLLAIGSHDNTLDILADQLHARHPAFSLSSGNVGSLGGLMALGRGHCHLAGTHLLDTKTGGYNISYIKKHLPGLPLVLVNLVTREQGLIVARGNPKKISSIAGLTRPDVEMVNRQAGSGTRILLDFELKKAGIDPADIQGYCREEYTHMAVGVDVLSGRADVGVGIYAAARALGLDFIPLTTEQYDLAIPRRFMELAAVKALLKVVGSQEFQERVLGLGGYGVKNTGQTVFEWDGRP